MVADQQLNRSIYRWYRNCLQSFSNPRQPPSKMPFKLQKKIMLKNGIDILCNRRFLRKASRLIHAIGIELNKFESWKRISFTQLIAAGQWVPTLRIWFDSFTFQNVLKLQKVRSKTCPIGYNFSSGNYTWRDISYSSCNQFMLNMATLHKSTQNRLVRWPIDW